MNLKTKQTKIRQNYNAIELMWFLIKESYFKDLNY